MQWFHDDLELQTPGRGLHDITAEIQQRVDEWGLREGMVWLFLQHTSASLAITENYDPSARRDLETFLERLAPEKQAWHRHTLEGPDDSPSHMRSLVTGVSQSIPVTGGKLALGTWQGVHLCEHRTAAQRRVLLIRGLGVTK